MLMRRRRVPQALGPLGFYPEGGGGSGGTEGNSGQGGGGTPPPTSGGQGNGQAGQQQGGGTPPQQQQQGQQQQGDDAQRAGGTEALRADLARERDARQALQRQLEELQSGQQTEHERAIGQARREAVAAADGKWAAHIRAAEVRGALRAAGIVNEKFLGLALAASEFKDLKVDGDTGTVQGVAEAVEKFRETYPEAFAKAPPAPGGQWDGAAGGSGAGKGPEGLEAAVEEHYKKQR